MISWKSKVSLVPCFVKAVGGPERATVVSLATSKDGYIWVAVLFLPIIPLEVSKPMWVIEEAYSVLLERRNTACCRAPTMISPRAGH